MQLDPIFMNQQPRNGSAGGSDAGAERDTLAHLVAELDRLRDLVASLLHGEQAAVAPRPAAPAPVATVASPTSWPQLDRLAEQLESVEAATAVANAYLSELALRVMALRDAARRGDERALATTVGALRSASLTVGAHAMAAWCDHPESTPPLMETEQYLASWLIRTADEPNRA